jgi:NAD(P)-dependent dehydrogenase (short-subunit alcohol dehydrogenase family)
MGGTEIFTLDGKCAVITGAGGAIGSTIAKSLSAAGAKVFLQDLNQEGITKISDEIRESGGVVFGYANDLSDVTTIEAMISVAADQLGGIDILINCAGINRRKPIAEVTPDDFDAIVSVNMRAVYFVSQAVYPHMKSRGGGSIVNISSITARYSFAKGSVYAATKAAVSSMARSFSREWVSDGIRVNSIEPGYVKTEFTRPVWGEPTRADWFKRFVPMGRLAHPEELVGAVLFLASDASSYVTGQSIVIDGGLTSGGDFDK